MFKIIFSYLSVLPLVLLCLKTNATTSYDLVVSKDGHGNFDNVQAAIDAAPSRNTKPFRIFIKKGYYFEKISVSATKNLVQLIGEDVSSTVILFGDGKAGTCVLTINADDFMMMNITVENTQGRISDGPQSLAIKANADKAVFFHCKFISGQDTVLVNKARTRCYFQECYIDGNTDFIYGAAIAIFERCIVFPRDRIDAGKGGYITAASTPPGQEFGFIFRNCSMPDNHGITRYSLGRPWQNDSDTELKGRTRAENKVVFINTRMGMTIMPQGWSLWNNGTQTEKILFAEYNSINFEGKPIQPGERLKWSKQLDSAQASKYMNDELFFNGWSPKKYWTELSQSHPWKLTVNNFLIRKIDRRLVLQFNSSWPVKDGNFRLYVSRRPDKKFKQIKKINVSQACKVSHEYHLDTKFAGITNYFKIKAFNAGNVYTTETLILIPEKILEAKNGSKVSQEISDSDKIYNQ